MQQQLHERNRFKDTTNKFFYLLKGLIDCPVCGGVFVGSGTAKANDYHCNSKRNGRNCGNRGIPIIYVENLVSKQIDSLEEIVKTAFDRLPSWSALDENELTRAQQELAELKSAKTKVFNLYEREKISEADFFERFKVLEKEEFEQSELEADLKKRLNFFKERESILAVTKDGAKKFKLLTDVEKRATFLRTIIKTIRIEWLANDNRYDIAITFNIDKLDDYLVSKSILVDRKKGSIKVLSEKVTLYMIDTKDNIKDSDFYLNYTDAMPEVLIKHAIVK